LFFWIVTAHYFGRPNLTRHLALRGSVDQYSPVDLTAPIAQTADRSDLNLDFRELGAIAACNACHTRWGVAGNSMCETLGQSIALMIAFMIAGGAPTVPASPTGFAPIKLLMQRTSRRLTESPHALSARGIA
jgi:hypothetical protein